MTRVLLILILLFPLSAAAQDSVFLEELTWPEVRDKIAGGATTALIPTGGTEQNGPHMVLGKHNYIVRYAAEKIARRLGGALVAPVIAYVPEGDIDPPTGHMRFPGTLSVRESTFTALLEDAARSLKRHGFKTIVFLGDSGGNQEGQEQVARALAEEWRREGVRVIQLAGYYDNNGQSEWLLGQGFSPAQLHRHAGLEDTSELLAAHPEGVRPGAAGEAAGATKELGRTLLDLKIRAVVEAISKLAEPMSP